MTAQKPLFSDAFIGRRSCLQHVSLFAAVFESAGRFSKAQPPQGWLSPLLRRYREEPPALRFTR